MASITPNPRKRGCDLPPGCKDLIDVLNLQNGKSALPSVIPAHNEKIRAGEVRVIGIDGKQLGIMSLADALQAAQLEGADLIEIAPNAHPPVCRIPVTTP